ncbi:MAG: PstS family phosphate ABC transporter substrate-binding protein [Candidatus Mcinerneyibacterium aminivorans]|uniref:Phosphate-binding protein n=1 Tax=Candidatus Mcinerneyibacterium aminivorans TaxID=2703815 RepID=A0A5D0MKY0_9BACT|nr:MAG: PstS family phosphate ABC transporter substrate-binding protein [Candidatus Mcinerneyibacterium aminivorans]
MRKKMKIVLVLSLVMMLSIISTVSVNAGSRERVQITGSTTVLPVAQRAAEEFMNKYDITVSVRGGGSGTGISALIDGRADIADASRPMKKKELEIAKNKGVNPKEHIIARDGIAVVINNNNPVDELTLDEVKKIFSGTIKNWKQVGGPDKGIVVVSRDSSSGTFEAFKEIALDGNKYSKDALRLGSNKAVSSTVARSPYAIGYIGMAYLSTRVKALAVDGVKPTMKAAGSGEYKIARPLFMYTDGEPTGNIKKFIDFVYSEEGQKIAREVGYVPVK